MTGQERSHITEKSYFGNRLYEEVASLLNKPYFPQTLECSRKVIQRDIIQVQYPLINVHTNCATCYAHSNRQTRIFNILVIAIIGFKAWRPGKKIHLKDQTRKYKMNDCWIAHVCTGQIPFKIINESTQYSGCKPDCAVLK